MIEIDGAAGAAGRTGGAGQILRTSIGLAAITQKPCRVFNIRKSRPNPGLRLQHLLAVQNIAKICQGEIKNDQIGSKDIEFLPGKIKGVSGDNLFINIDTAASITLLFQSLLFPLLFSPSTSNISFVGGGTDVPFSPTINYLRYVFLEMLKKMGVQAKIDIIKRGYYPEGGAKVTAKISPLIKLNPLRLTERGVFKKIRAFSGASDSLKKKKVAERQLMGTKEVLGKLKLPLEEKIEYSPTDSPGSWICLTAEFENTILGTDNLGKLGKPAEDVGREAALQLLKEQKINACLDKHLADQILPYLALSPQPVSVSVSELTDHCKTNIQTIEKFLDGKFEIKNHFINWIPNN